MKYIPILNRLKNSDGLILLVVTICTCRKINSTYLELEINSYGPFVGRVI